MAYEIFFTEPRGLYVPTNSYLLIIHYNTTYKKLLIYLYSYNRGTYQTSVSVRACLAAGGGGWGLGVLVMVMDDIYLFLRTFL